MTLQSLRRSSVTRIAERHIDEVTIAAPERVSAMVSVALQPFVYRRPGLAFSLLAIKSHAKPFDLRPAA